MISKETIESIIEAARIEEVVGEFVVLKRRGNNLMGLCPFHHEKTPSFTVSPVKGIYKCFGCGKAGNAVNFLMEHEHYTYPEALHFLAKKYAIEIVEDFKPEDIEAKDAKESLYAVNSAALQFFMEKLHNSETGKAVVLTYLTERGLKIDIIKKFQLGYSPDIWDAFYTYATENGYKKDYLIETGLVIEKENKLFDRFRSRVIFPIHNLTGRIIGFGGRILSKDPNKPKYLNSPESEIYNKSKVLYGLNFAKSKIISENNCFLVEGYMDVISMVQAGIENVVASSGTSLTIDQIKLIKRYTNNITILYDGDEAGLKASFRGINMILAEGMQVRVVVFPAGEDPDSFCRSKRPLEVQEYISSTAKDFITFKTNLLLDSVKNDPIKKSELIKEIVSTIAEVPNTVDRAVFIQQCSQIMEIGESTLMAELNKLLINKFKKNQGTAVQIIETNAEKENLTPELESNKLDSDWQEREIIRILLMYASDSIEFLVLNEDNHEVLVRVGIAEFIVDDISNDELSFDNSVYQAIFNEFLKSIQDNKDLPNEQYFINHTDKSISEAVINLIASKYHISENWSKKSIYITGEKEQLKALTVNAINAFKLRKVQLMLDEIEKTIKENNTNQEFDFSEALEKYHKLSYIKKEISQKLNRIVIK